MNYAEILVIIPIKDPSDSKTRLRSEMPSKFHKDVEYLVLDNFKRTITIIKELDLAFGIVSPSKRILDLSEQLGSIYSYQDTGSGLNKAIKSALEHINGYTKILILMPDLPFLSPSSVRELMNKTANYEALIVPSYLSELNNGTSALFLNLPFPHEFCYGLNSHERHKEIFLTNNIKYESLLIEAMARDLDTLSDFNYLKDHLNQSLLSKKSYQTKIFN